MLNFILKYIIKKKLELNITSDILIAIVSFFMVMVDVEEVWLNGENRF